MPKLVVNKNRCKCCKLCIDTCPQKIIGLSRDFNDLGGQYAVQLDESKCTGCKFCGMICPDSAISVYR